MLAAAFCLLGPATASAAPPIARPNPALIGVHLDYVTPIRGVSGSVAHLPPLGEGVIGAAVADQTFLDFRTVGDLGGFLPAPVGQSAYRGGGGRSLIGVSRHATQIPQYAEAANGQITSFALTAGTSPFTPPDNGRTAVPGLGVPVQSATPSNTDTVPPPNQGFGGLPPTITPVPVGTTASGSAGGATTTSPRTTPTARTTTPPTTPTTAPPTIPTTTPTTTAGTTTTSGSGGGGGGSSPTSCGTVGLTITSDHSSCRIYVVNMAPGDSGSEVMTIRNDSGVPFTLSLRASGTSNSLWNALQMGVWETGTAAPSPLPALLWWTAGDNDLATLAAGQTIKYTIELSLPSTAGNSVQGLAATIDLTWKARP